MPLTKEEAVEISKADEDAIIALVSLGFTKQECVKVIKDAKLDGEETIEGLIAYALKHIK
jgi:Holliday junction resolvasome RuvABC DNA-binding subunit